MSETKHTLRFEFEPPSSRDIENLPGDLYAEGDGVRRYIGLVFDDSLRFGPLLASAPDLLEALEGAQRALARQVEAFIEEQATSCLTLHGRDGNPDCTCGFCVAVTAEASARATIAKAKGGAE